MKFLAKFLLIFGIFLYASGIYLIWERNNPDRLSFNSYKPDYHSETKASQPVRIKISELGIDIPVLPAQLEGDQWTTTTKGASYLISSPVPGQTGNSIIYAHDWASLFGPLISAKPGQQVRIEFADKSVKTFIIQETAVVPNTQASILSQTQDKRITLYTCTGFLDSQRMVAVAVYKEDRKLTLSQ